MKILVIAQVAHAINAAYALSLGEIFVPTWEEVGEQHQQSLLAGVQMHLDNPEATPEQSHESWLKQKLADGWAYGETKDLDAKTHPCCRPYEELPPEQKSKDYIFRAVVHALKDIPDADEAVELTLAKVPAGATEQPTASSVPPVVLVVGEVLVQYIGRRDTFTDHLYGTGLVFKQGQVRSLPTEIARKFLRHKDQFEENVAQEIVGQQAQVHSSTEPDDTTATLAAAQKLHQEQQEKENQLLDLKAQVNVMTKKTLGEYALTNYRQKLDQGKSVAELRAEVVGMIDQFGPV